MGEEFEEGVEPLRQKTLDMKMKCDDRVKVWEEEQQRNLKVLAGEQQLAESVLTQELAELQTKLDKSAQEANEVQKKRDRTMEKLHVVTGGPTRLPLSKVATAITPEMIRNPSSRNSPNLFRKQSRLHRSKRVR